MSFLFSGSDMKYYFDLYKIEYAYYFIEDHVLIKGRQPLSKVKQRISELLRIYKGSLNNVGDDLFALSSNWYKNKSKKGLLAKIVVKNAYNYFRHKCQCHTKDALWTIFCSVKKKYSIPNYSTAFLACNTRATNDYQSTHNMAYLINVYKNPFIVKWFVDRGIIINQEDYALAQLVQWIWRSAIRNWEPVNLYLPSRRMRDLLLKW